MVVHVEMKTLALLFLLASFWTVSTSDKINGLDTNVFQQIQNVHNFQGNKEENFINIIWPELAKIFPETAKIPGIGLTFQDSTFEKPKGAGEFYNLNYMCTVESKIYPKLSTSTSTKVEQSTATSRSVVGIEAVMTMEHKTMDFKLNNKLGRSDTAQNKLSVKLRFNKNPKVKLVLEVPTFSTPVSDAKCLVSIKTVEVLEVKKPEYVEPTNTDKAAVAIVDEFWEAVSSGPAPIIMNDAMSLALRRSVLRKLNDNGNFWICPDEELKTLVAERESDYSYSPKLLTFCPDVVIAD